VPEDRLLQWITVDPHLFGGKPIIRGHRLAVEHVFGMLAAGDWPEDCGDQETLDLAPQEWNLPACACAPPPPAMSAAPPEGRVREGVDEMTFGRITFDTHIIERPTPPMALAESQNHQVALGVHWSGIEMEDESAAGTRLALTQLPEAGAAPRPTGSEPPRAGERKHPLNDPG
jgi:hypothetical protein